ncbi:MAG: MFS transporter [Burkholderiaceae bacterium]
MRWKDHPRGVLIALLAIHVLAHIDRNMLLGFSPQITGELALTNAQYGFLTGAVWVLSFGVMAVFMGTLADRYSRTRVMAAGILIWSVCTAASGAAQSFGQMVAARFLVASGEAALVPAAVSLLAELFAASRRGGAVGVFFMGIPLGIGFSFLLAGTIGATQGWRSTFVLLGAVGVVIALPLLLLPDRRGAGDGAGEAKPGAPFARQVRDVLATLRATPAVAWTIVGFVLVHMAFAGLSFAQLWLVRERGFDAAGIARQIGALQLAFGALGSVAGGVLSDRVAHRIKGGHAGFLVALVLLCGPLMIAYRLVPAGSALFYAGMCAGFFLPLATYGPANALIQGLTPDRMRSTVTGLTMMLINIVAIAIGNLAVGAVSDRLASAGSGDSLTVVLLATDVLAIASAAFFALAARGPRVQHTPRAVVAH